MRSFEPLAVIQQKLRQSTETGKNEFENDNDTKTVCKILHTYCEIHLAVSPNTEKSGQHVK